MIRNPRQLHLMRLGLPLVPANGGGGSGSTTSNSVSTPWTGQQPYLSSVFGGAQNTYNQYAGNPSSSVAGFTPQQQQAMGMTQNEANGTNIGNAAGVNNAAGNYTTNLLNGNYLNSNPGNAAFSQFANGSMMNNPYQTGALNSANDAITRAYQTATAPQTTSQMEGSGRYGSGAMMNAQSQNQQDLATQLGNTDASMMNSMYQQNMGNMLQGAQGLSGNYNTASQQQLAGSANAPNVVNSVNGAVSNLYNMGGNQQALNQSQINAPWQLLNNYSNLIQGQYGGNTSTSTPYYTNQMAGAMGGAMGGAALGSMMSSGSNYGTGAGAALGGLMGAYSDRRLKEDIEPTGESLENGLPIYLYRYLWDAPHVRRTGVMADEVRRIAPHAVERDATGFDKVNYDVIGGAHVLSR
ncbi:tail fiber domain-containing protein [Paraburkholderia sediminicola]|uniref:tail fiber domain-containing protein n=1 Tax=Paraburkholderia sediminicola TaxID=458836 RepID=UPI0038B917E5